MTRQRNALRKSRRATGTFRSAVAAFLTTFAAGLTALNGCTGAGARPSADRFIR